MSIPALSSTTLSAALDKSQNRFAVGSSTGINGLGSLTSPQSAIVVEAEAMLVLNIPASGTVEVTRGAFGTGAQAHPSGAVAYFGAKSVFGAQLHGDGTQYGNVVQLAGDAGYPAGILPPYRLPLGSEITVNGKVYVMCDFTGPVHSGVTVSISPDGLFASAALASGHQGPVGVCAEPTSSSDNWGWVQVYGSCSAQEAGGTSAATSAYFPIIAGSVSSPAAGMAALIATTSTPQLIIHNMFITGAATTNVTSAASHTGVAVPVFLNRPYVLQTAVDVGFS